MPSAAERVSGGRFPCGPKTTTGYPLPTLRVGLAGRTGGEYLTHGRAGKGKSELDAARGRTVWARPVLSIERVSHSMVRFRSYSQLALARV